MPAGGPNMWSRAQAVLVSAGHDLGLIADTPTVTQQRTTLEYFDCTRV